MVPGILLEIGGRNQMGVNVGLFDATNADFVIAVVFNDAQLLVFVITWRC
jgi:hypothetical protein